MVRKSSFSYASYHVDRRCRKIHEWANGLRRFSFPFAPADIPDNGIYILFEKGERAHGVDRIVRIGTHRGHNRLPRRLNDHFLYEHKDRSIFRKHIGRALLNKHTDDFLHMWNTKPTPRALHDKTSRIEQSVSRYIRENIRFCTISVADKDKRVSLEAKILSTISWCTSCSASLNWLGNHSPIEKVRESGLWNVAGLYKEPLSYEEVEAVLRT